MTGSPTKIEVGARLRAPRSVGGGGARTCTSFDTTMRCGRWVGLEWAPASCRVAHWGSPTSKVPSCARDLPPSPCPGGTVRHVAPKGLYYARVYYMTRLSSSRGTAAALIAWHGRRGQESGQGHRSASAPGASRKLGQIRARAMDAQEARCQARQSLSSHGLRSCAANGAQSGVHARTQYPVRRRFADTRGVLVATSMGVRPATLAASAQTRRGYRLVSHPLKAARLLQL